MKQEDQVIEAKPLLLSDEEEDIPSNAAPNSGKFNIVEQRRGRPSQKAVIFFHALFKIVAVLIYLFGPLSMSYTTTFIFVLLSLSLDFWIVKNVSGRLLVGLRWWNTVQDDSGEVVWHFESWTPYEKQVADPFQVNIFWTCLCGQQILWSLLAMIALFRVKLGWLVIPVTALCFNSSNLYCYIRCQWKSKSIKDTAIFKRFLSAINPIEALYKTKTTNNPSMDEFSIHQ